MRKLLALGIALSLGGAGAAHAWENEKAPVVLAEKDRSAPGGRAVQLVLAQSEIATTVDIGRVASSANGGGLLGAVIISSMDDKRKRMQRTAIDKAEGIATPLRQTLLDFDVAGPALAATRSGLAKPVWFQAQPIVVTRDGSRQNRTAVAASAGTPQVVFVDYWYGLSPDFSQIRVLADIRIERTGKAKADIGQPLFHQRVWSVVQLRSRSYSPQENAAQWSADNGKRARTALTLAFSRFEELIPHALGLGAKDIAAFTAKGREKAFGADFYGPLISRDPSNPQNLLLWSDGLVQVQPID